jgi:ABC-type molybdate transport system substrate-binding protein
MNLSLVRLLRPALASGLAVSLCAAQADPFQLYAAGSLREALQTALKESGLTEEAYAKPVFGPAGDLRERIEKGEHADLSPPPTWRSPKN